MKNKEKGRFHGHKCCQNADSCGITVMNCSKKLGIFVEVSLIFTITKRIMVE